MLTTVGGALSPVVATLVSSVLAGWRGDQVDEMAHGLGRMLLDFLTIPLPENHGGDPSRHSPDRR